MFLIHLLLLDFTVFGLTQGIAYKILDVLFLLDFDLIF